MPDGLRGLFAPFRYSAMSGSASGGSIVLTQQGGCVLVRLLPRKLSRGRETLYLCCRVARGRLARLAGDVHINLKCHRGHCDWSASCERRRDVTLS